ncbi:MAG TPA: branched-chain amino acid aminotransferase [Burkholderiales bacterium]|nr:branched-chain amino acid aminotransferase [Burkholderiales bacterium]
MSSMEIRIEPATISAPASLPEPLGFGRHFTGRMFTRQYTAGRGWHDAVIGPYRPLGLDPAAIAVHCGQMVFDGTKAYLRPDGDLNLFRPEKNAERLNRSAARMAMPAMEIAEQVEAIAELVRLEHAWTPRQDGAALYVRPVMIGLDTTLEVRASRSYLFYIILSPVAPYFAGGFKPISVLVSDDFVRTVRGGTGEAKTPGNYAGSLRGTENALAAGYQQVLWLDAVERRYVDEVGAMNIAFVYEGKRIVTPALSGAILHGITRESLLRLAPDLGYTVEEARIDVKQALHEIEAGKVTEAFGIGTGAVIAPVGRFGYQGRDYKVGTGDAGPVARHLFKGLTDIQYGRVQDPYGWTRRIAVASASVKGQPARV